jgi:amino-acid N-acetyltransferase
MKIEPLASIELLKEVVSLCGLPIDDLSTLSNAKFFGISEGGTLVAVVGLELYGEVGLLRSLAVLPSYRNTGLGNKLVRHVESFAKQYGIEQLYLLTTTAEDYFLRFGYVPAIRDSAPMAIKATSQFSGLCPASSAFLIKQLRK